MQDEAKFMRMRMKRHKLIISPSACVLLAALAADARADEWHLLAVLQDLTA
jgi:hypothetical protein